MNHFGRQQFANVSVLIGLTICPISQVFASRGIDGPALHLTATNAAGTATYVVPIELGYWYNHDQVMNWSLDDPVFLTDPQSGNHIGVLLTCQIHLELGRFDMPMSQIGLDIGILCDANAGDTIITAESPLIRRRTIPVKYAVGRATANVTVSDLDGDFARSTSADIPGDGMARFTFNGVYPGGNLFSHLVGIVFAGPLGTSTGGQNDPPFGYRSVGFPVRSLSTRISMRVTQNDIAFISCRNDLPSPPAEVYGCAGDVDLDRDIDLVDLSAALAAFGFDIDSPGYDFDVDFNEDGVINLNDLSAVLIGFGTDCP